MLRSDLSIDQILRWADEFHRHQGKWPNKASGRISGSLGETWLAVEMALRNGGRRLPYGDSTLSQLLAEHRGARNRLRLPEFNLAQILVWAKAHHERTGMWPTHHSGVILDAPGESWLAIDKALRDGSRGLPGGSSLSRLLRDHFQIGVHRRRPRFTILQILAWADAFNERHKTWPTKRSGPIREATAGTSWMMVHVALIRGLRGLPGASSLPKLLGQFRGARFPRRSRLSIEQIVAWAQAYYDQHGRLPAPHSERVVQHSRLTWLAVNLALRRGYRGLPGGSSLSSLLHEHFRSVVRSRG